MPAARRTSWSRRTLAILVCIAASHHTGIAAELPATMSRPSFESGTYDASVPTPETILGFPIGTRPVRYDEMRRYFEAVDAASPRVTVRPYARSHEGRDLVYAAVGTESRVADLEAVRGAANLWADPRRGSDQVPEGLPVVAWLGYAIHGDELSSTDAALQILYQLAAGQDSTTARIRANVLVCIDPLQNPDGRERYLAQMQSVAGVVPNPDAQSLQHQGFWPWGRANHYLFDLNRDWIFAVHPETRGRLQEIGTWKPQLVVDSHEMGWDDTYLFSPAREPFNPHLPRAMQPWVDVFSRDQSAAFDRRGWGYYTREWNEEFFPGYGSSWAAYHGAVGILYEQASTDGSLVRQSDGSTLEFRDAIAHQFTSSITNLDTAARNRAALLRDYRAARRAAVEAGRRGAVRAFGWSSADSSRAAHLAELLVVQGIEVYRSRGPLTLVDAHDMWSGNVSSRQLPSGSWVVPLDQPLGALVRNLLEFHVAMPDSFLGEERDWIERGKGTRLYDATAWSLLLGHAVDGYWCGGAPRGDLERVASVPPARGRVENPRPDYSYVIDGHEDAVLRATARLLERGTSVRIALEPFDVDGRRFARGSALLRLQSNPDSVHAWVVQVADETGVVVHGVDSGRARSGPDLGGNRFPALAAPRVALVTGEPVSSASYGAIWHLLDHDLEMRVSSLSAQSLDDFDLSTYNVLVLPRCREYGRVLGSAATAKLRNWVESGGTLIAIAEGAAFVADSTTALSKVRLRRQALGEFASPAARQPLPDVGIQYAVGDAPRAAAALEMPLLGPAALAYVRATRPRGVRYALEAHPWPSLAASGKPAAARPEAAGSSKDMRAEEIERADQRLRRFRPRGALLRVDFDAEHWLTAGLGERSPVFADADLALIARPPVEVAGRYARADSLHLSGLLWPEGAERLARTAFLTRERRGKGQVILFAGDPVFRRSMRGLERLFVNAIVLGPGLGTERPAPW